MHNTISWILVVIPGLLVTGQFISVINFPLAQKLGLQEKADASDPVKLRAELHTAYWDLLTLVWLPLAGILMLVEHPWWPYLALIGGAVYVDAGGREAAKMLSMRAEGIRIGTPSEQRLLFGTFVVMGVLGLLAVGCALVALR